MSEENLPDEEGDGIKNLRKQYDAIKKERDEFATELDTFRAEKRVSSVAEVFKAKNLPENAAKLYTGSDTSPEAVGKWIEEFADVFNVKPVDDANAQNAQRVSDASFGAPDNEPAPQGGQVLGDPAEIQRAITTLPYEELVKLGYMPKQGTLFNNGIQR